MSKIVWRWNAKAKMPMRCLAVAEGYAMVRNKGCSTRVIEEKEWLAMPLCNHKGDML